MIEISDNTRRRIEASFPQQQWNQVSDYLVEQCGDNLPNVDSEYLELAERIRFAVLKLARGNQKVLRQQVDAAKIDWRDVLMAAGFAEDTKAHLTWSPN